MANIGSLIAYLGVDTSGLRSAAQDFKQFETTTSTGLSSMTKGVVALAAAFASLKMVQGGKDAVMFAASVEQADVALRSIANSMGVASDKAIKYRDALRDVNITTSSATNATAQFIRMGLPIEKLNQLGTAAQGAAINYKMMTGETISSSEALDKMVHAIATGQNIVLHNLGIMTSMKDIYRENRQETGQASSAIDSHKRHLLVLDDVLEKTVPLMNLYKDSTGLATKNISSSKRPLEEMKLALGNLFLPELTAASLSFYQTVSAGQKWVKSHGEELITATGMIKDFSEGMLYAAGVLGIYATAMGAASLANGGFAATTGLFTGLLSTMRMQLSLTGATATVMATQINAMGVSVATAMQVATVGVLSLKAAIGVLSGFMIGWEIGKWWSTFESGAKAGVYTVNALVTAWDWLAEAAEKAWVVMKGSATTWGGVMKALDDVTKRYEKMAEARKEALQLSLAAAHGTQPGVAPKDYKEDPAQVAANAARIAKEQAEAAALAGAEAARKLAEQWAKTRRGLEQELKLEGLTGLEKTLQEITNRAEELRATAGTDKAWVKNWEEQTKAAATYRDELVRISTALEVQGDLVNSTFDFEEQMSLMSMTEAERAVAGIEKENQALREKANLLRLNGKIVQDDVYAEYMAQIAATEINANDAALKALRDKSDTTKDIWKNMYQSLQSITADWLENMKISWSSLGTLFKKFVAQMVSAWAWGQASMAWAGGSPASSGASSEGSFNISNLASSAGSLGGAAAIASTMAGPDNLQSSLTTSGIGMGGALVSEVWGEGASALSAGLQAGVARVAQSIGLGSVGFSSTFTAEFTALGGELATGAGASSGLAGTISGMTSAAFSGWAAGIGTFVIGLLQGKKIQDAAIQGIGAGLGAWGGATVGTMILPGIGTVIGSILGSVAGSWIGSLFGNKGENKFTLGELVQPGVVVDTIFEKTEGLRNTNWAHAAGGNSWYQPIANAYSDMIGVVNESFTDNVFAFAEKMPDTLRGLFLDKIAATDYTKILASASGGRWGVSGATGALEGVATAYATALSQAADAAYSGAIETLFKTADPSELLGSELSGTWAVLTDAAQAQVRALFVKAGDAIATGGLEAGLTEAGKISDQISQIATAMAPIQEIIDTNGLSEYELAIRSINKEFDSYAVTLEAAGIDLSKYTQLEEARTISLAKAAEETSRLSKAMQDYIESAKDGVQAATDAEKSRLEVQQSTLQDNLQAAEGLLRRSFASEIESIGNATQKLIDGLNTRLQTSQKTISTLGQAVSKLTSAADSMAGAGSRAGILSAISGIQGITQSVRGGDISGLEQVDKYLSIVTGDNTQYYASFEEYQRDFLKAKIAIMDLNAVAGDTLSTEEQMSQMLQTQIDLAQSASDEQISALNSQLNTLLGVDSSIADLQIAIAGYSSAQATLDAFGYEGQIALLDAQLNELMGINTGIKSLAEALQEYAGAVVAAMAAGQAPENWKPVIADITQGLTEQWVKTSGGDVWQSAAGATGVTSDSTQAGADPLIYTQDGRQFTVGNAIDFVNQSLAAGDALAVYSQAKEAGISLSSLETMMGWTPGLATGWASENGLPSFAKGTDFLPFSGPVQAHYGERITPAAYNRSDATNAEIVAELKMLRRENEAMRQSLAEIKNTNKRSSDVLEKADGIGWAVRV